MTNWLQIIKDNHLEQLLLEGNFGLEKENIRIDEHGHMVQTPHPISFAEKGSNPYITTDFAESQIELVTPICSSILEAKQFIETLQDVVQLELKHEYLWPYSQPPILPDNEAQILEANFKDQSATDYRKYLSQKYGKHHQLLSGVHFNFSLTEPFLKKLHQFSHNKRHFHDFKNHIYLKMARFFVKHSWFIIYMTGYGDIIHQSYAQQRHLKNYTTYDNDAAFNHDGCCFRTGHHGYQNLHSFPVDFNSLEAHIQSFNLAIAQRHLIGAREYYSPLRLKGEDKPHSLESLKKGINYLEIRCIDLNPFEECGISLERLELIHLFLLYGLLTENTELNEADYLLAQQNNLICSHQGRNPDTKLHKNQEQLINIHDWAQELLQNMWDLFHELKLPASRLNCLKQQAPSIKQLTEAVQEQGYIHYFLQQAKDNLKQSQTRAYQLRHYEDLELSTQVLLCETIKQGIEFNFLDRKDNFIELKKHQVKRRIKQATKTELDNYIAFLAMENKIVSKKLLAQMGLSIAEGKDYSEKTIAFADYKIFKSKSIVIKPNSTNFGEGITILNQNFSLDMFQEAIDFAFQFDEQILIEHFFPGKEYRFLVMGDETIAVLHREAANVIGDGFSSIEQLVIEKNKNPLRGEGYRKPLEKIKLGDIETQFLAQQQLNIHSIPRANQKIYLRKNSNISTGGDSIDFTEQMPDIYKQIAIQATKSVDAVICGVDMIVSNLQELNPQGNYCIIELNFNPAIHMHTYPLEGRDRKIALKLLKLLKLLETND